MVLFHLPVDFNPPTPCGVGRIHYNHLGISITFQSTHPVWGGTLEQILSVRPIRISIHPPRVGWDAIKIVDPEAPGIISIHPPRVGWDLLVYGCPNCHGYFNPPTPCGVGPSGGTADGTPPLHFNPPTPCGVGRYQSSHFRPCPGYFNPPTPCGVGPVEKWMYNIIKDISIHPPRVGWDGT